MKNKILLGAGLSICALAWAAKDPVIMTVNGVDVPKSEFEYLYNKNSKQQIEAQPLSEYVEMFKNYKLKVADAKALGIDTLETFRKEMAQYRTDLAAPYMADSAMLNRFVDEAFRRAQEDVEVAHIMFVKTQDEERDAINRQRLDSIRQEILKGSDFAEMAKVYSEDKRSGVRGGSLGYIAQGNYPYYFEKVAYDLKPGEISGVVESPMVMHIIKAGNHRPAKGQVLVSHILLLDPQGGTPEELAKVKERIDSIHSVVAAEPKTFAQTAKKFSQDPGSASKGGRLDWFGIGRMVPEFEEVAFSLDNGEISQPFHTPYGWHIILRHEGRKSDNKSAMKPALLQRVQNPQDDRSVELRDARIARLAKKHHAKINEDLLGKIRNEVKTNGLDSAFYLKYQNQALGSNQLATIGKKGYSVADFMPRMRHIMQPNGGMALMILNDRFNNFYLKELEAAETDWLEANEPAYRNLYNEYRDGSLLYEASVRNVWDKAAKDTEGLTKYFEDHRSDYTWSSPRVKGILVQAKNDSVARKVKDLAFTLLPEQVVPTLRKEFKSDIKIDKVLVPEGANVMVDNLVFGKNPVNLNNGFTEYFLLDYKVLEAPEDMTDVRPQVTGDYQMVLEEEWIKRLRDTYPVTVNEKVLKTIKAN
ncbi:MAG: peptidylprolyl isomerase [Muribaculaceae bacterium]|nr:peptidylprolyl isomerase [Muribaculaceae bacterium]